MTDMVAGTKVRVVKDKMEGDTSPFLGKVGIVKRTEAKADLPVLVKFPERIAGYGSVWFHPTELEVVVETPDSPAV